MDQGDSLPAMDIIFSFCCTYPYHMRPLSVHMLELSSLLRVQPCAIEYLDLTCGTVNRINVVCLLFDLFKFKGLSGQVLF